MTASSTMTITRRKATAIPAIKPTFTTSRSCEGFVVPGVEGEGVVVMGTVVGGGVVMTGSSTVETVLNAGEIETVIKAYQIEQQLEEQI